MKKSVKITASLIALAFAPTLALAGGNCTQAPVCGAKAAPIEILNNQIQLDDAIAVLNVNANSSHASTLSGVAVGNAMSTKGENFDTYINSNQKLHGDVASVNHININNARGATISTSVAQGNTAQIETKNANLLSFTNQETKKHHDIDAVSIVNVKSSDLVVSNAQAAGNNWAVAALNEYVNSNAQQNNGANVYANSHITACCNNVAMTSGAVAAGNTNSIATENSTVYSKVNQNNEGRIGAFSSIKANSGTNVTSAANAVANNATVTNKFGYVEMAGAQYNSGAVKGQSTIVLNDWRGTATSSASAMGNSALVSNIGSDVGIYLHQNNYASAPIMAQANFYGSSSQGGVGMASSMAVGNAITGYSCSACSPTGVSVGGRTSQTNYASVSAVTNMSVGSAGSIIGSATAIGNTATFIAQGRN